MASTSTLCPYCEKHTHTTIQWGLVYDSATRIRIATTCDNCDRLIVGEAGGTGLTGYGGPAKTVDLGHVRAAAGRAKPFDWLPLSAEAPDVPDVPESIARAAKEAYSSATVGNYMASTLMARTVIEATAKTMGITNGNLAGKINAMRDAQLIRPAIAEQAHEVRFAGNDMAHGDIDEAPDAIDSEEILALMGSVLTEVFQDPARLERIRAKRVGG
ncbi:DUF4145 domain-containing protein [Frigoribacterium faeni]|uniref:DUF4145 domain-containing protein n=1 Tax=Frigoribacterium faeni TaxID=145483 RepID=UPI002413A2DE|nr:DUF4145 domain-containing protein [Frigoribacterium faeni]